MIIRIMGLGQYKVPSTLFDELNVIDNTIVDHVSNGNEELYKRDFYELICKIKQNGKKLESEEIIESDIIVPPEDLSFEEAKSVFLGCGLFID